MKIVWSERALTVFYEIIKYIAVDSVQNARMIKYEAYKAVKNLEIFPDSGVAPKDAVLVQKGYKMLIVEKYLVFYLIGCEEINIVAVIHGARKYSFLLP